MNLIEVQDKLSKLPPLPESIQYLTTASQGGNPLVPPYMALARISEINQEIQSSQQPQAPAEPLNQSLPKQAMQSMGIGALGQGQPMPQQGMPQQGMPQQAPRPMPQGMPQQGMPQQPPQGAQPVRMAASGGLMGLPVDSRMFEYGSGGIVAFNGEDNDQVVESEGGGDGYDPEAEMRKLQPQIRASLQQEARPVRGAQGIEKQLTANRDYGVDEGPIGKGYLEGLAALKAAKEIERGRQQGDIEQRRKNAVNRALLDFSDASRGQTGIGGIGALGRSYMGSSEKLMGEEAALREDAIKTNSLMNEAQYKIQALRQAQLKGDVAAEQKADMDLAKIAKDLGVAKSTLIGRLATGNLNLMGKGVSADAAIEAARIRGPSKGTGAGTPKSTDQSRGIEAIAAGLKLKFPDMPDAEIQAEATRLYRQSATAPAVAAREAKDINEAWRKQQFTAAYMEARDKAAYEREWRAKWRQDNPDAAPAASAPKPAAGSVIPTGGKLGKFVPGKGTEVIRDGKLIGYVN